MATRRRPITTHIVAVLVACALGLVAVASAAQVTVNAPNRHTDAQAPCTIATLPTTVQGIGTTNRTHISIQGVPAACNGLPISVVVYRSTGVQLATGTGTATTGTTIIGTTSYAQANVAGVALLIDTWGVRTTWSLNSVPGIFCEALTAAGVVSGTCTVSEVFITPSTSGGYDYQHVAFVVTSSRTRFRITFNFSVTPVFAGWTPVSVWTDGDTLKATMPTPAYSCSQLPVVQLNKRTGSPTIPAGHVYEIEVSTNPTAYTTGRVCP